VIVVFKLQKKYFDLHIVMLVFFHLLAFVVCDYFSPDLNKEVLDISRQVVAALFEADDRCH